MAWPPVPLPRGSCGKSPPANCRPCHVDNGKPLLLPEQWVPVPTSRSHVTCSVAARAPPILVPLITSPPPTAQCDRVAWPGKQGPRPPDK